MMPNLGQGGCQAIEDAFVLVDELESVKKRTEIEDKLRSYHDRRLIRSAVVQGLSRFASDIIIRGFDTPAKIARKEDGGIAFENFNYAGKSSRLIVMYGSLGSFVEVKAWCFSQVLLLFFSRNCYKNASTDSPNLFYGTIQFSL